MEGPLGAEGLRFLHGRGRPYRVSAWLPGQAIVPSAARLADRMTDRSGSGDVPYSRSSANCKSAAFHHKMEHAQQMNRGPQGARRDRQSTEGKRELGLK